MIEVVKLRLAGRIRPADQFNLARQTPCTFFSSTTFPTVDGSATAMAAACLLLAYLPHAAAFSCKQRYKSVNKMVWFHCCDFTTILYILTTYFCIDYVNRTVSGPPGGRQSRIRLSGQKV